MKSNPVGKLGPTVKLPISNPVAVAFQVQLLDNLGRKISGMETDVLLGGQVQEMKIPALPAGVYHIRVMAGEHVFYKQLVVQ